VIGKRRMKAWLCLACKANLCDDLDDKWICPDCGWTAAMLVDVVVAEQEPEALIDSVRAASADADLHDGRPLEDDHRRPGDDSHWATVVIDDAFEPREITEAESVELDESGLGIAVDRMWIRPGVRREDTERCEGCGMVLSSHADECPATTNAYLDSLDS
jgi:rRNA maturation endonuclease Nob1